MAAAVVAFSFFSATAFAGDNMAENAAHDPHGSGTGLDHKTGTPHSMGSPHSMGGEAGSTASMPKNFPKVPEGPILSGKVTEVINGGGYSYLYVEADGKKFWIAGIQVEAKVGDVVNYIENVSMEGFTSRSLNKTFDRIIFASSVSVLP